jgi:sulfide:quinone oxidoreductase
MTTSSEAAPRHVVIVGGGIAALEAVLALHDLAGARVRVTLIAPSPEFSLRPLSVLVPFGRSVPQTVPLDETLAAHGGTFRQDAVLSVDAARRVVVCASGDEVPYDALLLAPGARAVPAFDRGLTFDPFEADALSGVVADLEQGWSRSVAFIVPVGTTWPLPLYELALMTAEQVWGMGVDAELHFVTPEPAPLAVFGDAGSAAVAELLAAARITFHGGATPQVPRAGRIELGGTATPVAVDRIVALSRMQGPEIIGVPADTEGFIDIDALGRVPGMMDVWAVGDATQQPIKQGGLACQQADAVAAQIAAAAGADVETGPPVLELRGRLLAGHHERFIQREVGTAHSAADQHPLWWPPAKVASRYLAPYLEERGLVAPDPREPQDVKAVDVRVPIDWENARRAEVLGLSPLGPIR